ncbi:MAG: hypothetical protein FJ318_01215 [SAR202 cluster bacterium]|nr:hypothetical protein [SAR202 cluster bacterium]
MEILELVDRLEAMATHAKKVPITGRAMIDAEKLLELVDQMRLSIPRNIGEAQEVLDRREQILNQTMIDAKRVKAAAENEAGKRVDDNELVKNAKKRADEIVQEAHVKSERLLQAVEMEARNRKANADTYAHEVLTKLEEEVANILSTVRTGIRVLSPSSDGSERFVKSS